METITIFGHVGQDPEMRYLSDGTAVTNFSVAVNRWRGAEKPEITIWYRVSAWGRQAETVNTYVGRGDKVLVVGELVADEETGGPRTYNRNDGTVGASFEVRASRVEFGARKDSVRDGAPAPAPAVETVAANEYEEDDIPF